jgi:hypothetical protein
MKLVDGLMRILGYAPANRGAAAVHPSEASWSTFDIPASAPRSIKRPTEFVDFLSFILLYAPDRYPERREMNNSTAFAELFETMGYFRSHTRTPEGREAIDECIRGFHVVYEHFERGDDLTACHLLQETTRDFQRVRRFIALSDE